MNLFKEKIRNQERRGNLNIGIQTKTTLLTLCILLLGGINTHFVSFMWCWGTETRALCILGKYCITDPHAKHKRISQS